MSWFGVVELFRWRYLWFLNFILCVIRFKSVVYLDCRYECLKSVLWLNKFFNVVLMFFCLYEKNRWVEFNLFFFILFVFNFFYMMGWGIVVVYIILGKGVDIILRDLFNYKVFFKYLYLWFRYVIFLDLMMYRMGFENYKYFCLDNFMILD